jgi:hypothetical protein
VLFVRVGKSFRHGNSTRLQFQPEKIEMLQPGENNQQGVPAGSVAEYNEQNETLNFRRGR